MRYDQHRPPLGDAQQVGVDDRLAFGVERAGGFVEDQDARIADEGASDRNRCRWPPDRLVDPSWMNVSYPRGRRSMNSSAPAQAGGPNDLFKRGARLGSGDGFPNGAAEQEILLQHDAEIRAQMIDVDLAQIVAVDLDQSLRNSRAAVAAGGSPSSCRSRCVP